MLKTLLRRGFGFVNVGSLLAWRARSRRLRDQPFMLFGDRVYTYAEVYRESLRIAQVFDAARRDAVARAQLGPRDRLAVGIYQENTPEFVFAGFGAALSGSVLFGVNTGFRGQTLATVINQAEIRLLLTESKRRAEIDRLLSELTTLRAADVLLVDAGPEEEESSDHPERRLGHLAARIAHVEAEGGPKVRRRPRVKLDNMAPFLVIYTSGTTGAPKGVPCSQFKLVGSGVLTWRRLGLSGSDRGYICMPLFHSNSWFLGIMPLLVVGGSFLLKRRFSASAFEADLLEHGITYMNYVGQPIHYILHALERKHGSGAAVEAALAEHPDNHFRIAHGNGATPIDREKLVRYLGMEHVYELYGSTEAAISTVVKPGDPPDSVGEIGSKAVVILDASGGICPPGEVDGQGRLTNYDRAVGEIARKIKQNNIFFDGYWKNAGATDAKFRDGYFRSGDLGHIRVINGRRYLYFDGRTDDWIRKDGENFSAENVVACALELPEAALAVAYGVPGEVADDKVMIALQLADGAELDPRAAYERFRQLQRSGGMDPKWMPDYIRVVPQFPMTETQKIRVRPLKLRQFRPEPEEDRVYYRRRGDETYHPLTADAYAAILAEFERNGRRHLLERG